jgi:quercetin dioxygenase-like cupin family protein
MHIRTAVHAAFAVMALAAAAPASAHDASRNVTTNFDRAIPNIPGKSVIALIVDYAPGEGSPSHVHAKSAFIYAFVIAGAIESQVNDGAARVYKAGESWFEPPGAHHRISRNASKTEPAKLLAVFVVDTGTKDLTTYVE